MAWLFQPINDDCLDCGKEIAIQLERHYVVFDDAHVDSEGKRVGAYRRQCGTCYDAAHQRPYERRSTSDAVIHGRGPDPKPLSAAAKRPPRRARQPRPSKVSA